MARSVNHQPHPVAYAAKLIKQTYGIKYSIRALGLGLGLGIGSACPLPILFLDTLKILRRRSCRQVNDHHVEWVAGRMGAVAMGSRPDKNLNAVVAGLLLT